MVSSSTSGQHHTRAHGDLWEGSARQGEARYGKGKFQYLARGDYPHPTFNGQKFYVKGIVDATGQEELFEIANVILTFEAQLTMVEMPLSHGEYDGIYFSTGLGVLGDATVQSVYTETTEGGLDVVGRIDGPLDTLGLKTLTKG